MPGGVRRAASIRALLGRYFFGHFSFSSLPFSPLHAPYSPPVVLPTPFPFAVPLMSNVVIRGQTFDMLGKGHWYLDIAASTPIREFDRRGATFALDTRRTPNFANFLWAGRYVRATPARVQTSLPRMRSCRESIKPCLLRPEQGSMNMQSKLHVPA